ncbi:hypothetical protein H4R33_000144 [Dimargaris cristalligena]|nr:hypothetical protein H4R33_000144 [Dimargaris cristalligena]
MNPTPSSSNDVGRKLKKTCDLCSARRYRCNGLNPCSSCERRLVVCHYSYYPRRKAVPEPLVRIVVVSEPQPPRDIVVPAPPRLLPPTQPMLPLIPRAEVVVVNSRPLNQAECGIQSRLDILAAMLLGMHLTTPLMGPPPTPADSRSKNSPLSPLFRYRAFLDNMVWTATTMPTLPQLSRITRRVLTLTEAVYILPRALPYDDHSIYHPSTVRVLVSYFFDHFVYWEPFLQLQRFYIRLAQGKVPPSLFNAILAFASQLYSDPETKENPYTPLQAEYIARAESGLFDDMDCPSLDTVTTITILAMISCNIGETERLNTYMAIIHRTCSALGLHLVDSPSVQARTVRPLTRHQHVLFEVQRRAFWSSLFLTSLAGLIEKTTSYFDTESAHVEGADDLDFTDFFLTDDPDNLLPTIVCPLYSGLSTTSYARELVFINNEIARYMGHSRVEGRASIVEIQQFHAALDHWFASLPPAFVLTRANVRDATDADYVLSFRNITLMQLAYYLAVFVINSEPLLERLGSDSASETFKNHCRERSWAALADLVEVIVVPSFRLPVGVRPLNSFLYAWYGLEACTVHLKNSHPAQRARYYGSLSAIYNVTRDYAPVSRFSRALRNMFATTMNDIGFSWDAIVAQAY